MATPWAAYFENYYKIQTYIPLSAVKFNVNGSNMKAEATGIKFLKT